MTIYILDSDPAVCAKALDDKSLHQMIKDIAQVLVQFSQNFTYSGKRLHNSAPFNKKVIASLLPWYKWAQEIKANYLYLLELGNACLAEHELRGFAWKGKARDYVKAIFWAHDNIPDLPIHVDFRTSNAISTPLPLVMPKKYIRYRFPDMIEPEDKITSYRNYYQANFKINTNRWTNRQPPDWLTV